MKSGAAILLGLMMLGGCTRPLPCRGIAPGDGAVLTAEASAAALRTQSFDDLRCRADSGDPVSQYLLGVAYEHGIGTPADRKKAIRAYKRAAVPRKNRTYIYSPPVGKESAGRVIPVTTGPDSPGLPQAKAALERLAK